MSHASSTYLRLFEIAEGGMGVVELAVRRSESFERLYAVKRLREVYRSDARFKTMFLEEARIAGWIRHPNVVSVLDIGEDRRGPHLVMEFIEGVSVSQLIVRLRKHGLKVPMQVALAIAGQTAQGLHAAHELRNVEGEYLNLIHRDVSPQNILLGYDGFVRVTDFGIAKALGRETRTDTGILKGKLGYLAPEVLRFEEVNQASDLFALGVVLYELLALKRLYGSGTQGARRILSEAPPDIGEEREDAPDELVALMLALLAKDPMQRPTAHDAANQLNALASRVAEIEDSIDLPALLGELFEEEQRAFRKKVQASIERSRRAKGPSSSRRALGLGLGLGLVGMAGIGAWAMTGPAGENEGDGSVMPSSATSETNVGEQGTPAPVVVQPVAEPVVVEPAQEASAMEAAPPPASTMESRRRRRRQGQERSAMETRGMAPDEAANPLDEFPFQ